MGKNDMIYLYSGTPGSGKSLDMARSILIDLKFKRPVICNFPIAVDEKKAKYFNFWDNGSLDPSRLVRFSNEYFKYHKFKEGGICLYIDECQLLFNARSWNEKGRSDWNAFFTNHRHFGYDIVLISQFDRMIDRQIRSLIEIEVIHRKVNNMGIKGAFFRILFLSPTLFVKIHYYYPTKDKLNASFFRYNRKYAKIYDSYSSVFIQDQYMDDLSEQAASSGSTTECSQGSATKRSKFLDFPCFYKIALFLLLLVSRL